MLSRCDCTREQREHPAHEGLHAALDAMLARGELEIVGVDGQGKSIYRRSGGGRLSGARGDENRFGRSGGDNG
jgi:hypothetical protein